MDELLIKIMNLLDEEVKKASADFFAVSGKEPISILADVTSAFVTARNIRDSVQNLIDAYINEALKDYARKEGANDGNRT